MTDRTLTEQQEIFVDKFLEEVFAGTETNLAAVIAKEAAGYSADYKISAILKVVNDEIVRQSQLRLTMAAPLAIKETTGVLVDPTKDGARRILDAANSIMDRAGISKKEHVEMEIKADSGVVIIPPKQKG